eukprot:TRINITY_DN3751_c1_g1_i2.p2 TRINITY_DN3751_c1_g1~~TRINITY_DN3751_c1_g1_i2.p2  ORF type:complete len:192 (-),score=4.86 TRINITY_DN3751_c1_g1_i2:246-821(-)
MYQSTSTSTLHPTETFCNAHHRLLVATEAPHVYEAQVQALHARKTVLVWVTVSMLSAFTLLLAWHLLSQWLVVAVALVAAASLARAAAVVTSEKVSVMIGIGVAFTTQTAFGPRLVAFLDWSEAGPLVMNEYVTTTAASYYLAYKDLRRKRLCVLFEHLRPRYAILQRVYQGVLDLEATCQARADTQRLGT